jgi:hypothetical protein
MFGRGHGVGGGGSGGGEANAMVGRISTSRQSRKRWSGGGAGTEKVAVVAGPSDFCVTHGLFSSRGGGGGGTHDGCSRSPLAFLFHALTYRHARARPSAKGDAI